MKQFLRVIAEGYTKQYKEDISRLTFVMPNIRSGTFLLKYFEGAAPGVNIAPRIISISDFIAETADNVVDSRIDLLFRLYDCYRKIPGGQSDMSFEKFSSWGETILNDFNEVDMQMVDSEILFTNLNAFNSIRTNFFTDEQKKVLTDFFHYNLEFFEGEIDKFWKKFEHISEVEEGDRKKLRKKFYTLWQLLRPLYDRFKRSLHDDGLTTQGGAYREVAEMVEEGLEPFKNEKLIFVGFNALSESERRIFKALKGMKVSIKEKPEQKADFVWDMISYHLSDSDDPAMKHVALNSKYFSPPTWLKDSLERALPVHQPEIEVIAVPSNIMQVKMACDKLEEWKRDKDIKVNDENVAVVLADETLLLPLLHTLPESYPKPNLTMGFPLRQTSVISFASLLRRLHLRARKSGEESLFLFEDVKNLLSHPYSHILFGSKAINDFLCQYEKNKLIMVTGDMTSHLGENANRVFQVFSETDAPSTVVRYIEGIFAEVKNRMSENGGDFLNLGIEGVYISTYVDALVKLNNCLKEYDNGISAPGVFLLADKLIAGETIAFEGKPLMGLQVMGVLETRCLDFERIVLLSANEKVMPKVGRGSTFIPNVIRAGYGMPPANYQEEIFAYYFFRILSKCSHGVLTYDSRHSDNRNPGPSRYILQMKYLGDYFKLKETEARFGMPVKEPYNISVEKTGIISDNLKKYRSDYKPQEKKDQAKNFSPSALSHYFNCPVQFLFSDVLGLYVEPEKEETIDSMDMGTIIHKAIEKLYIPNSSSRGKLLESPIVFTKEKLEALLRQKASDGKSLIREIVTREILKTHFNYIKEEDIAKGKLRGSAAIIIDYIVRFVENIIRKDIESAPFRLWGSEIEETLPYTIPCGPTVNLKIVIDRLDQEGEAGDDKPFRIVDYKTGAVHLNAPDFENLFDNTYTATNIFQLLFYAELFMLLMRRKTISLPGVTDFDEFEKKLKVAIYSVLTLGPDKGVENPVIGEGKDKKTIETLGDLRDFEKENDVKFMEVVDSFLSKILDESLPFASEPNDNRCKYCDYQLRCELYGARQNAEREGKKVAEKENLL